MRSQQCALPTTGSRSASVEASVLSAWRYTSPHAESLRELSLVSLPWQPSSPGNSGTSLLCHNPQSNPSPHTHMWRPPDKIAFFLCLCLLLQRAVLDMVVAAVLSVSQGSGLLEAKVLLARHVWGKPHPGAVLPAFQNAVSPGCNTPIVLARFFLTSNHSHPLCGLPLTTPGSPGKQALGCKV